MVNTATQIAEAEGLANVHLIVPAAEVEGLPLPVAFALMEQESGGRNVWGHDQGGALSGFEEEVTLGAWRVFRWMVIENGHVSNGVGPAQITWAGPIRPDGARTGGLFTMMEEAGLKPWRAYDNMRFGFRLLRDNRTVLGSWRAAAIRYNGSEAYGDQFITKLHRWRDLLREV